ncbi:MAG TPA: hypothetical protein VMF32_26385 [Xanthobacteraceae bacterium]|nr:hypothetical protein [Xanthobacteraceae bacterium]
MDNILDGYDNDPDLVRCVCDHVFNQLKNIGGKRFAKRVFKGAFWFDYDGKHPPFVLESILPWFLTRAEGASFMLDALVKEGIKRR